MTLPRRSFLQLGAASALSVGLGIAGWRRAFAAPVVVGVSPYGALGIPDAKGVALPAGFSATLLATSGQQVANTAYEWHGQPDGGATFATPGGCGALRFNKHGSLVVAYSILTGTKWNCAGGATPWGTWLSCEEHRAGLVWECDPFQPGQGTPRPALGKFPHEAAVVDPTTGFVYLTEDDYDSRFYRFRPDSNVFGHLSSGVLEAAAVQTDGTVRWVAVKADRPYRGRDTTGFARGEGAWYSAGVVYFCTTADNRVWAYDVHTGKLEILYDATLLGDAAPLREPDNVTVHDRSGDIYVAEDADDLQLVLLADGNGKRIAAPFLQLSGHDGSEVAGPAFSPDGTRLYVTSQRGRDGKHGMTFEINPPFAVR